MKKSKKIKCNNVEYRKGYIEVIPGIHDNCINLETWNIHVDVNISNIDDVADENLPEDAVTGNTEIEMSINEAEELVQLLQQAIHIMKQKTRNV